jgi:predicted secreted protein
MENHMKTLSERFKETSVKKGECFAIDLESNVSTGYAWAYKVTKGSASKVSQHWISADGKGIVTGGSMIEHTIFRAEEAGEIQLQAQYARRWEKAKAPAKSYVFTISVS